MKEPLDAKQLRFNIDKKIYRAKLIKKRTELLDLIDHLDIVNITLLTLRNEIEKITSETSFKDINRYIDLYIYNNMYGQYTIVTENYYRGMDKETLIKELMWNFRDGCRAASEDDDEETFESFTSCYKDDCIEFLKKTIRYSSCCIYKNNLISLRR